VEEAGLERWLLDLPSVEGRLLRSDRLSDAMGGFVTWRVSFGRPVRKALWVSVGP